MCVAVFGGSTLLLLARMAHTNVCLAQPPAVHLFLQEGWWDWMQLFQLNFAFWGAVLCAEHVVHVCWWPPCGVVMDGPSCNTVSWNPCCGKSCLLWGIPKVHLPGADTP